MKSKVRVFSVHEDYSRGELDRSCKIVLSLIRERFGPRISGHMEPERKVFEFVLDGDNVAQVHMAAMVGIVAFRFGVSVWSGRFPEDDDERVILRIGDVTQEG